MQYVAHLHVPDQHNLKPLVIVIGEIIVIGFGEKRWFGSQKQ